MNIAPDLYIKQQIIENAVEVAKALELINPKVAILCAKEKVDAKMGATVDAAKLQMMNEQGEIKHCVICGPLALDVAVSKASAQLKNINHTVAGDADILVCPTIEAGNILYKCLVFLTDAQSAGVIVGAKAPIVLTSRADSAQTKLNSIALSVLLAGNYA
jgi:phosphate butyryltransferase